MKIEFYGTLRDMTGSISIELDVVQTPTVAHLFDWIFEQYPHIRIHLLDADGHLAGQIPVFVNGRNPRLKSKDLAFVLKNNDTVSLFSPISSGKINVETAQKARSAK